MKVLFCIHWLFSVRQAGSERMTDWVAQYLIEQGHEVGFYVDKEISTFTNGNPPKTERGFPVYIEGETDLDEVVKDYDIVWTHLNMTRKAINAAKRAGKPLVNMIHAKGQMAFYEVKNTEVDLTVYNSQWLYNETEPDFKSHHATILIPPTTTKDYAVEDRSEQRFVTHLNCNEGKGVMYARHWAMEMPEYPFLFVMGSYFKQFVPRGFAVPHTHLHIPMQEIDYPSNVTFSPPTKDVFNDVLRKTKVAVVPSTIDSWGLFAIECCAAGIPVIAHPDPGFLESLGPKGLFVDRKRSKVMCDLITKLMEDDAYYAEQQLNALQRAADLEALAMAQMQELVPKMQALVGEEK